MCNLKSMNLFDKDKEVFIDTLSKYCNECLLYSKHIFNLCNVSEDIIDFIFKTENINISKQVVTQISLNEKDKNPYIYIIGNALLKNSLKYLMNTILKYMKLDITTSKTYDDTYMMFYTIFSSLDKLKDKTLEQSLTLIGTKYKELLNSLESGLSNVGSIETVRQALVYYVVGRYIETLVHNDDTNIVLTGYIAVNVKNIKDNNTLLKILEIISDDELDKIYNKLVDIYPDKISREILDEQYLFTNYITELDVDLVGFKKKAFRSKLYNSLDFAKFLKSKLNNYLNIDSKDGFTYFLASCYQILYNKNISSEIVDFNDINNFNNFIGIAFKEFSSL